MIGLADHYLADILNRIAAFPEIETVILFGSRADGSFKPASDIDLAIDGEKVDAFTALRLQSVLEEETDIPLFFDVVALKTVNNTGFLSNIRKGRVIYEKAR